MPLWVSLVVLALFGLAGWSLIAIVWLWLF